MSNINSLYLRNLARQAIDMNFATKAQMQAEGMAGKRKVMDLSQSEKVNLYVWLEKLFGRIYTMFDDHKRQHVVGGQTVTIAANYMRVHRRETMVVWSWRPMRCMGGNLTARQIFEEAYKSNQFLVYDMPCDSMRQTETAPPTHNGDPVEDDGDDDADDVSFSLAAKARKTAKSPALAAPYGLPDGTVQYCLPTGLEERMRELLKGCAVSDDLLDALSHGLVRQNTALAFTGVRQAFARVAEAMKKAEEAATAMIVDGMINENMIAVATVHDEVIYAPKPFRDWVVKRGGEQPPANHLDKHALQKLWGEKE